MLVARTVRKTECTIDKALKALRFLGSALHEARVWYRVYQSILVSTNNAPDNASQRLETIMNSSTYTHIGSDRAPSSALQAVREFLAAWLRATPAYIVYRAINER